jgi:hypothetical protein
MDPTIFLFILAWYGAALVPDAGDPLAPPGSSATSSSQVVPAAEPQFGPRILRVVSPNGRREFTQSPKKDSIGPMVIRELPSRRVVDHMHFMAWGQPKEVERVIWNPKGSAFMVDSTEHRGPISGVFLITDRGLVDLDLPETYEKIPWHDRKIPVSDGQFPYGGWEIVDWLDDHRFRMGFSMSESSMADCKITYRITRGNRVVIDRIEDLISGSPAQYHQMPAAPK